MQILISLHILHIETLIEWLNFYFPKYLNKERNSSSQKNVRNDETNSKPVSMLSNLFELNENACLIK